MFITRFALFAAACLAACCNTFPAIAQEKDNADEQKRRVIIIEQDDDDPTRVERVEIGGSELPAYWIGVLCRETDDGLSIAEVLPESPAAKVGLKAGDRIVSAAGQEVAEVSDLVDAVQESKGEEIEIQVERDGETLPIKVAPEMRPDRQPGINFELDERRLGEGWREVMPQLRGLLDGEINDFDISIIHPGLVIGDAKLPAGVKITIRRENDQPAKLLIERGDEKWEVTEETIDELPEDLRDTARKMLAAADGRSVLGRPEIRRFERFLPGGRNLRIERRGVGPDAESDRALKEEIEEMREEIRELRKLVEELKGTN